VPRSTPKSCSIRANSASFFRSASLPLMTRQSETRRLMYLPDLLVELRLPLHLLNTDMSGSMRPITRVYVASEMPFC